MNLAHVEAGKSSKSAAARRVIFIDQPREQGALGMAVGVRWFAALKIHATVA